MQEFSPRAAGETAEVAKAVAAWACIAVGSRRFALGRLRLVAALVSSPSFCFSIFLASWRLVSDVLFAFLHRLGISAFAGTFLAGGTSWFAPPPRFCCFLTRLIASSAW